MPIRAETFRLQPPHRALGQITVLKTAAGKHDAVLAGPFGNGNDGLGQRVVELGGNVADGNAGFHVGKIASIIGDQSRDESDRVDSE